MGYEDNNSQWDRWVHGGTGKDAFQYRLPGYESDELISLFIRYLRERGAEARAGKPRPFFAALSVRGRCGARLYRTGLGQEARLTYLGVCGSKTGMG